MEKILNLCKKRAGFSVMECIVFITVIGVIGTILYVIVNPPNRLKDARDAKRTSDVDSILTAVRQYMIDNGGNAPIGVSKTRRQIGTQPNGCAVTNTNCAGATANTCVDLRSSLSSYLKSIPVDPENGASDGATGYFISQNANGIITVEACYSENTSILSSR